MIVHFYNGFEKEHNAKHSGIDVSLQRCQHLCYKITPMPNSLIALRCSGRVVYLKKGYYIQSPMAMEEL